MPIYEYQCTECDAVYELQQSFSAETTHTCEECGKGTAKRVLHAPRVVFKGSGWYVTDSRKANSAISEGESPATESTPGDTPAAPASTTESSSSSTAAAS